ncbi:MAG: chemotaxis protein CheR [Spirochaetaceae bacterium]|nr:chemotaxis protein CheR [Spirochaetaceae bacterium]
MIDVGLVTKIPAEVLSSPALLFLYYRIEQILGIKAGGEALIKLNNYLEEICGGSFIEKPAAYEELLTSREKIFEISKILTIGETYFFREGLHFDLLLKFLPQLAKLNRPLQICSAATSIGCEAYSIAMLLDYQVKNGLHFDFAIDAFDVNAEAIEVAKNARYSSHTLRKDGSDWKYILDLYLIPEEKEFVVSQDICKKVRFFTHNIMRGLEKQYDVIFFRNSLIYFSSKSRLTVLNNLAESLLSKGLLFLGVSETSSVNRPHLAHRNLSNAFYFEKNSDEIYYEKPIEKCPQDISSRIEDTKLHNQALRHTVEQDPAHKVKKSTPLKSAALPVDCGEVAAILNTEEGQQNAEKILSMLADSAADSLSGAELVAAVMFFLNSQDFNSADMILAYMEKRNAGAVGHFLRGEYYYLLGKTKEAEKCFEDVVIKDKVFWPAFYRIANLAAEKNKTRYEYKIKKAIESIELLQNCETGDKPQYECFMGGFSPDYFRRILERKLATKN